MRLAFLGTPEFSVTALEALVAAGHDVACVYTQPPRPAGRGQGVTASPVERRAEALGLPVRHPETLRSADEQAAFAALDLEVAVVVAYGLILPRPILAAPRRGCLNIHASLLPRWRGAAPIQRALLAGDTETGITIMQMDPGLDTGPMLLRRAIPIAPDETGAGLHDRLMALGAEMIVAALAALDRLTPVPQPAEGVTYAAKLTKADGRLAPTGDAADLARQVRALTPWPGAYLGEGAGALKVLAAEATGGGGAAHAPGTLAVAADGTPELVCGTGRLRLLTVQRPGRPPTDGAAWWRGARLSPGARLDSPPDAR